MTDISPNIKYRLELHFIPAKEVTIPFFSLLKRLILYAVIVKHKKNISVKQCVLLFPIFPIISADMEFFSSVIYGITSICSFTHFE